LRSLKRKANSVDMPLRPVQPYDRETLDRETCLS
jgi:hypothetical protein